MNSQGKGAFLVAEYDFWIWLIYENDMPFVIQLVLLIKITINNIP